MAKRLGNIALLCLLAALAGGTGSAQVTTEEPASVLVFPKVIADGSRDTFIQISNAGNSDVHVQCFYVNAQLLFPDLPPGPFNPPLWQEIEFDLTLTAQQPTNWVVSAGRPVDPNDPHCRRSPPHFDCYGAGTDPGPVPQVPDRFVGELLCIEVDVLLFPISGNHLTGEATIADLTTGDVAKYGAIGLEGFDTNNGDGELMLGEEYTACPEAWILGHTTEGSEVPSIGAGSALRTDVTIVPCAQDFANQIPAQVTLQLSVSNEFEQNFSASTSVDCWGDFALGEISSLFESSSLGTLTAQTRLRPVSQDPGILVVAEEFRSTGGVEPLFASSAGNAYAEGTRSLSGVIRIP